MGTGYPVLHVRFTVVSVVRQDTRYFASRKGGETSREFLVSRFATFLPRFPRVPVQIMICIGQWIVPFPQGS